MSHIAEVDATGAFQRQENAFATPFGEGAGTLPVAAHRYRLLWAPVCPWAHRAVIVRRLLGLESVISLGTLDPLRPTDVPRVDWAFTLDKGEVDPVLGIHYLSEAYLKADPAYQGRPTVPALVDLSSGQVVYNDYHELTYELERKWKPFHRAGAPDLLPVDLEADIRALSRKIFTNLNNGVYRGGFAESQQAYDQAYADVFSLLDELELRLAHSRYLFGNRLTDADVRLYVTLARFDAAYHTAFRMNRNRLIDFPNLWAYARDLYQTPGFGDTTNFLAIKQHYFTSITIDEENTGFRVLPKGPDLSVWQQPSGRDHQVYI